MIYKFIPSVCLICNKAATHQYANLCSGCTADFEYLEGACQRCALPLPSSTATCGQCLKNLPNYDQSFSALIYKAPADRLILSIKNHGDLPSINVLCMLFIEQIRNSPVSTDLPDVIVPVPLHWKRQIVRGFNQAEAMAGIIGQELGIKVESGWLKRIKETRRQTGLTRSKRLHNLSDCFATSKKVSGRKIALFDDVITTGATMEAASGALKKSGAQWVEAWSIARTPKF